MKIDFSTPLHDLDGEPIKASDAKDAPSATLAKVTVNALLQRYRGEEDLEGEKAFKRWDLARRVNDGGTVDLAAEEVALVKKLVAKLYPPAIVGPAYMILEGKAGEGGGSE